MDELSTIFIFSALSFALYLILVISLIHDKERGRDIEIIRSLKWLHPNWICAGRTVIAWVGTYFYFFVGDNFSRCLGIAFVTVALFLDAIDGLIARACDLETETGKWFDPLCDKLVCLPILILFAYAGDLSFGLVFFLTVVEGVGQFSRKFISIRGGSIAANNFGKAKMILECVLIVYCVLLNAKLGLISYGDQLLVVCIALSILSFSTKFMSEEWQIRVGFLMRVLSF